MYTLEWDAWWIKFNAFKIVRYFSHCNALRRLNWKWTLKVNSNVELLIRISDLYFVVVVILLRTFVGWMVEHGVCAQCMLIWRTCISGIMQNPEFTTETIQQIHFCNVVSKCTEHIFDVIQCCMAQWLNGTMRLEYGYFCIIKIEKSQAHDNHISHQFAHFTTITYAIWNNIQYVLLFYVGCGVRQRCRIANVDAMYP